MLWVTPLSLMEYKCPDCGSVIYSRKNVLCGVCGKRLPDSLLFTPAERAGVDQQMEDLKRREKVGRDAEEKATREPTSGQTSDSLAKRVGKHYPVLGAVIDFFTRSE
jgi:uncharacterized Zn finger protein (UPF0148 family)